MFKVMFDYDNACGTDTQVVDTFATLDAALNYINSCDDADDLYVEDCDGNVVV